MAVKFAVLASGSAGNASLIEADGFGLLLDAGLGPRSLARRLAKIGASWDQVHAAILTHTHSDHWSERTFAHLTRKKIPLYCHSHHRRYLRRASLAFAELNGAALVRSFQAETVFSIGDVFRCRPLTLRHDGGATFGFRFEVRNGSPRSYCALGYVADLGSWNARLAQSLADVDVLALEFNHDVGLEHSSGRSAPLIARVLGDHGHLSNRQAAELLRDILRRSRPGRPQHLIQLHISRDCNLPNLAAQAAHAVLGEFPSPINVHTANQFEPLSPLVIENATELSDALSRVADWSTHRTPERFLFPEMAD